jgi:hypothetical protein
MDETNCYTSPFVHAAIVNILGKNGHTVMRNTDALLDDIKENGLYVKACKYKYVIMYHDQNAEQNHGIKNDIRSFVILK